MLHVLVNSLKNLDQTIQVLWVKVVYGKLCLHHASRARFVSLDLVAESANNYDSILALSNSGAS